MKVSIIIPVRTVTPYLKETVDFINRQTEKDFETIVVSDRKEKLKGVKILVSKEPTPAYKRNMGASKAGGGILAFLDDDSYPSKNWLKTALNLFEEKGSSVAAVCGPMLTPPTKNIYEKVAGFVWSSWLGGGGTIVYRNKIMSPRYVDDFPTANLLVRKKTFDEIGGFNTKHWPGEDTKLCLDLVMLGKKIIYDPKVLVYHHRRPVFLPHLKQISRYALRRGHFARVFPKTSLKFGYLIPSLFTYGLFVGGVVCLFLPWVRVIYASIILLYLLLLLFSGMEVFFKEKNFYLSFLVILAIFATHFVYGLLFPFGYFQKKLETVPHKVDIKKGVYVGG